MLLISFSVILSPLSLPRRVRRRWEFSSVCITPRTAESLRPHRGLKLSNKRGGEREKKKATGHTTRILDSTFGKDRSRWCFTKHTQHNED